MHRLSTDTEQNIISRLKQRQSLRKISSICNVSKSAVQRIRAKHLPDIVLGKAGRPQKLSAQDKRFCVRAITSGELKSAVEVTKKLETDHGLKVNDKTVRNALREANLGAIEKETKPKLSNKNIKARLEFAKRHKDWTLDDWRRVIWSDESKINRFCSDGRAWCWIRDGEQLQSRHVKETVKHGGGSIMIWGCMTALGPGFLCKIDTTMDQHLYKEILEEELLKTIEWYELDANRIIFQQDNDPKHKAKLVQKWIAEQAFETLEWPPQSPDLNPIEHLWCVLKRKLNQYESAPKGMLDLWERVQAEWEKISKDECLRLIDSMPRRISAVLKSKGKWTDY
jgi:hypothetical protein